MPGHPAFVSPKRGFKPLQELSSSCLEIIANKQKSTTVLRKKGSGGNG